VHARFHYIVATMITVFISSFTFWAVIYYVIWRIEPKCFLGFHSFLSAFLFSIETQNTIGEGPSGCTQFSCPELKLYLQPTTQIGAVVDTVNSSITAACSDQ
jgi:hypothetical protein